VIDRCVDRHDLIELFGRDRGAHVYALADLEEPCWSMSRWWRRGDAAVGEVRLPGVTDALVYAVSSADPDGTVALLADLADELPQRFVITGPTGLARRLSTRYDAAWSGHFVKMRWTDRSRLLEPDGRVLSLGADDITDISDLLSEQSDDAFFHAGLLDVGPFVGIRDDGRLVAVGGVHVMSREFGVAAIGNVFTARSMRGRGLARAVVSEICRRLVPVADVVALNVSVANASARYAYEQLGFAPIMEYDEAELSRRR